MSYRCNCCNCPLVSSQNNLTCWAISACSISVKEQSIWWVRSTIWFSATGLLIIWILIWLRTRNASSIICLNLIPRASEWLAISSIISWDESRWTIITSTLSSVTSSGTWSFNNLLSVAAAVWSAFTYISSSCLNSIVVVADAYIVFSVLILWAILASTLRENLTISTSSAFESVNFVISGQRNSSVLFIEVALYAFTLESISAVNYLVVF